MEQPRKTNEASGGASYVERVVRQREYFELAQRAADRQRCVAHEMLLKQEQFENAVCVAAQQACAMNDRLVMSMFYAALRMPNAMLSGATAEPKTKRDC